MIGIQRIFQDFPSFLQFFPSSVGFSQFFPVFTGINILFPCFSSFSREKLGKTSEQLEMVYFSMIIHQKHVFSPYKVGFIGNTVIKLKMVVQRPFYRVNIVNIYLFLLLKFKYNIGIAAKDKKKCTLQLGLGNMEKYNHDIFCHAFRVIVQVTQQHNQLHGNRN